MQVIELPEPEAAPWALGFSPDGRFLAAWEARRVWLIDTATGSARVLWKDGQRYSYCTPGVGFTANGKGVVAVNISGGFITSEKELQVHNTKTGKTEQKKPGMAVWAMDAGPNGLVALAGWSSKAGLRVEFWDTRTDKRRLAVDWPVGFPSSVALSACGKWLAGSCVELIRVWDFTGKKPPTRARRQFRAARNETVRAIAVSAGGGFVAATSTRLHLWDMKTGKETRVAEVAPEWGREIAFHPTRPVLAFSAGKEVGLWDAAAKAEVRRFAWDVGRVNAVAFSPDGLRCAAAGSGKVVVWDVDA